MNTKRSRVYLKIVCIFTLLIICSLSQPTSPQNIPNVAPIPVQPVPVTTVDETQSQVPFSIQPIRTEPISIPSTQQSDPNAQITINTQPQPQPQPPNTNQPPQPIPQTSNSEAVIIVPATSNTQQPPSQVNEDEKPEDDSPDIYRTTVLLISSGGEPRSRLEKYNVSNLDDAQKQVDKFIRGKAELGDTVNLTNAKGNGKQFQYVYQNNTQNSSQSWAISVSLADINDSAQTNNSAEGSTQKPTDKYTITGFNYVQNNKLSQQQKQELEEKMKKREQKMKKYQRQFEQQMDMMREMGRMNRRQRGFLGPFGWGRPIRQFDSWY